MCPLDPKPTCKNCKIHCYAPENRAKIAGKSAAIVTPFEDNDPQMADPLVAFLEKSLQYLQMNAVGTLRVPGVTERGDVLSKQDCLDEAFALGKRLACGCS